MHEGGKTLYKHIKDFRYRNKEKAVIALGGKCVLCGYCKCMRALEFHHLNPEEKSFAVSANLNRPWSSIEPEIKKCVLLCANCHREVEDGLVKLDGVAQPVRVFV